MTILIASGNGTVGLKTMRFGTCKSTGAPANAQTPDLRVDLTSFAFCRIARRDGLKLTSGKLSAEAWDEVKAFLANLFGDVHGT
jgi:hypothetical protein